jgi:hypothetical protein
MLLFALPSCSFLSHRLLQEEERFRVEREEREKDRQLMYRQMAIQEQQMSLMRNLVDELIKKKT